MDSWSFCATHEITFVQISKEANVFDMNVVNEQKVKIESLIVDYHAENAENCDAMFFFVLCQWCISRKQSKERLTIVMCRWKTWKTINETWKSPQPRCFKNANCPTYPVVWCSNSKAWMDSEIIKEWLKTLNQKMKKQNSAYCSF